jgi:hypothetical protein
MCTCRAASDRAYNTTCTRVQPTNQPGTVVTVDKPKLTLCSPSRPSKERVEPGTLAVVVDPVVSLNSTVHCSQLDRFNWTIHFLYEALLDKMNGHPVPRSTFAAVLRRGYELGV